MKVGLLGVFAKKLLSASRSVSPLVSFYLQLLFFSTKTLRLSFVLGASILATMSLASSLGSMLPIAFKSLGIDPAVASGPLVTTGTDILSISIYFTIASILPLTSKKVLVNTSWPAKAYQLQLSFLRSVSHFSGQYFR